MGDETGREADGHVGEKRDNDGERERDQIYAGPDIPDELGQLDPDQKHHRADDRKRERGKQTGDGGREKQAEGDLDRTLDQVGAAGPRAVLCNRGQP